MEAIAAIKAGSARSKDGAERDRGTIVHLVPPLPATTVGDWFSTALCGTVPRRGGNGWCKTIREVTCPTCNALLERSELKQRERLLTDVLKSQVRTINLNSNIIEENGLA